MGEPEIVKVKDAEVMSQFAADIVDATLTAHPTAAISLPTGSTPEGMYAELARRSQAGALDLSQFQFFCLDEYVGKTKDDPNSLTGWLFKTFIDPAGIPPAHVHTLPTTRQDIGAGAAAYEAEIANAGGLELAVLGVGGNGHIAYNEPGSESDSRTRVVQLTPESIAQADGYFGDAGVPDRAMTVGVGTLLEARRIVLIAAGAGKAEIMFRTLREPMAADVPASWLRLAPEKVTVVVDEAAAVALL